MGRDTRRCPLTKQPYSSTRTAPPTRRPARRRAPQPFRSSPGPSERLLEIVNQTACFKDLDPVIVAAVIEQESNWNTFAIRSESKSGFARRYGRAYARIVKQTASKRDDRWFQFPDIFYSSYGLMQVMYPVAVEQLGGDELEYPTLLCMPEIGTSYGCALLAKKIRAARGDLRKGLLFYNGGGDKRYPDRVLARTKKYGHAFSGRACPPELPRPRGAS